MAKCRLIVALDGDDFLSVGLLAKKTAPHAGMFKIGSEFWTAHHRQGYDMVRLFGRPIMLDLKFHDIPKQVARTVSAVLQFQPTMLTIHASGGSDMIQAACDAACGKVKILAVTVLTSLTNAGLRSIGVEDGASVQAGRLADLAFQAGANGFVCSPHEVADLRKAFGNAVELVVPGIRPVDGSAPGDHARASTPRKAAAAGADWIVVGQPIREAYDPQQAAAAIATECWEASP